MLCLLLAACAVAAEPEAGSAIEWASINSGAEADGEGTLSRQKGGSSGTARSDGATNGGSVVGFTFQPLGKQPVIIGLAKPTSNQGSPDYGLILNAFREVLVIEAGNIIGIVAEDYANGDVFEIRIGPKGDVQYVINDDIIQTSSVDVPSNNALEVDVALRGSAVGPVLGELKWIGKQAWCNQVECTAGTCKVAGDCVDGECEAASNAENGKDCNDEDGNTLNDQCTDGTCAGVDPCKGKDCSATDACHEDGVCKFGKCFAGAAFDEGTECDDGQDNTDEDQCVAENGAIVCAGAAPSTTAAATTTAEATTESEACDDTDCPAADECHEDQVCKNDKCFVGAAKEDGTECDDGNDSTGNDACSDGVCQGDDPCADVECEDKGQCYAEGECNSDGECVYEEKARKTKCDDEDDETDSDACYSGVCIGIDRCLGKTCQPLSQCHTAGECSRGTCSNPQKKTGTDCDDGDDRTVDDKCNADGVCEGEDLCVGVTCKAVDDCHDPVACNHENGKCPSGDGDAKDDGTECDDGNAKTTDDVCTDGKCAGENPCTNADCNSQIEQGACNRKTTCTVKDDEAVCAAGAVKADFSECDDGDETTSNDLCIDAVCSGVNLCEQNDVQCKASDQCHVKGECLRGKCSNPAAADGKSCDDGNDLTKNDACDSGTCAGVPLCKGITCGDPKGQCYEDQFCDDDTGKCVDDVAKDDGTACDDDDEETANDQCSKGECGGTDLCADIDCPSGPCFNALACTKGQCPTEDINEGEECDDGNQNTVDTVCSSGDCVGTDLCANITCARDSECHTEVECVKGECVPANDGGEFLANGTLCDDGNGKTVDDTCTLGSCAGVDLCADVSCDAATNCRAAASCSHEDGTCVAGDDVKNGTSCDDGDVTTVGVCTSGVCESTPFCDDQDDGAECNDGDDLTDNDVCTDGECAGVDLCVENEVECPDVDECLTYGERECANGECVTPVNASKGASCDDADDQTAFDVCDGAGNCAGRDLCEDVVCPEEDQCNSGSACSKGQCPAVNTTKACDDEDDVTTDDMCQEDGSCKGTDECKGVTCETPPACQIADKCWHGECLTVNEDDDTPCDDNDDNTENDVCVDGACTGTDKCEGVTCPARNCRSEGECVKGKCTAGNALADGAMCEEGEGVCTDSLCINICELKNVTCAAKDQCHDAGECTKGECPDPAKADGTSCDDDDDSTDNDVCIEGTCVGTDLCVKNNITCPGESECLKESDCKNGLCPREEKADNTECDDGNEDTTRDVCSSGLCGGKDYCGNVTCAEETTCLFAAECRDGDCFDRLPKKDGIVCNDKTSTTFGETCDGGECTNSVECIWPGDGGTCVSLTHYVGARAAHKDGDLGVVRTLEGSGWDASAVSEVGITHNSTNWGIEFRKVATSDGTNIFVGLGPGGEEPGYNDINYGIFLGASQSQAIVYEEGEFKSSLGITLEAEDTLTIRANGAEGSEVIEYIHNGKVLYTSEVEPSFPLYGEIIMHDQGSGVSGLKFVTRQDILCEDVECEAAGACYDTVVCLLGECQEPDALVDGTKCDDGDSSTGHDFCESGLCGGVDLCESRLNVGEPACDDGNAKTIDDECDGNGQCVGVDLCADIPDDFCKPATECTVAEECLHGNCLVAVNRTAGHPCDDGNELTSKDLCSAGVCSGVDLCLQDDGSRLACDDMPCAAPVECKHGQCIPSPLNAGDACSDNNRFTLNDTCVATNSSDLGLECAGVDRCLQDDGSRLQCEVKQCYDPVVCFDGQCDNTPSANGTACDDGNEVTGGDACDGSGQCVGVNKCEDVECPDPQCYENVKCITKEVDDNLRGVCVPFIKSPNGQECDDSEEATDIDVCTDGVCKGQDLCKVANVECTGGKDDCNKLDVCFRGECIAQPKAGESCVDGEDKTTDDVCTLSGDDDDGYAVCKGVDKCDNAKKPVLTEEQAQCLYFDECFQGVYEKLKKADGEDCIDGNDRTTSDKCDNGVCAGEDLCVVNNVQCPEVGACEHDRACLKGECLAAEPKPENSECTDGDETTVNDACSADGKCIGVDLCADVTCDSATTCRGAASCDHSNGQCVDGDDIADETVCNDGSTVTRADQCTAGECVGTPLTCAARTHGLVRFNNGCGGYDITGTRWMFVISDAARAKPCQCRAAATWAYYAEADGRIRSAADCAQAICAGGNFNFEECKWDGEVVATGSWSDDLVTVPYKFQDTICTDAQYGEAVPPDQQITTTAAATTAAATTSAAPSPPAQCGGDGPYASHVIEGWSSRDPRFSLFSGDTFTLNISLGDSVEWQWGGAEKSPPMNVKSGEVPTKAEDGPLDSGSPEPLDAADSDTYTYKHRFSSVANVKFHPQLFPGVGGTVVVANPTEVVDSPDISDDSVVNVVWSPELDDLAGAQVTIDKGQTINWGWEGYDEMFVRSGASADASADGVDLAGLLFKSETSKTGQFAVRFNEAGTYQYHGPYAYMRAFVVVEDSSCEKDAKQDAGDAQSGGGAANRGGAILSVANEELGSALLVAALDRHTSPFYFDYALAITEFPEGVSAANEVGCYYEGQGGSKVVLDALGEADVAAFNAAKYVERSVKLQNPLVDITAFEAHHVVCNVVFGTTSPVIMEGTVEFRNNAGYNAVAGIVTAGDGSDGRAIGLFTWAAVGATDAEQVTEYHVAVVNAKGVPLNANLHSEDSSVLVSLKFVSDGLAGNGAYYAGNMTVGVDSALNVALQGGELHLTVPTEHDVSGELSGAVTMAGASELQTDVATTTEAATTQTEAEGTTAGPETTTEDAMEEVDFAGLAGIVGKQMGGDDGASPVDISGNAPETIGTSFSIAVTTTQDAGTNGYLFAKTDAGGDLRHYGVYVGNGRVQFWYRYEGGKERHVVGWKFVSPGTGRTFRLLITVSGQDVQLIVESDTFAGQLETQRLRGNVQDCKADADVGCKLVVGARADGDDGSTRFAYEGTISFMKFYPNQVLAEHPETAVSDDSGDSGGDGGDDDVVGYNLLQLGASGGWVTSGSDSTPSYLGSDGSLHFDGSSAIELQKVPDAPTSSGWSVSGTFQQTANTNGYLFAKTDAAGSKRYYGLYSNAKKKSRTLDFYYRSNGLVSDADRFVKSFPTIDIADGKPHRVTLAVYQHPHDASLGLAELLVDDENPVYEVLAGQAPEGSNYTLSDCGAPAPADDGDGGCAFYVGQRSAEEGAKGYNFEGSIYSLAVYPARLPGLPSAMEHQGADVTAANLLASNGGDALAFPGSFLPVSPLRKTEGDFTVSVDVELNEQQVQYIFCKSTASGSSSGRYLCLYANSKGELYLYYRPASLASKKSKSVKLGPFAADGEDPVALAVGRTHALSLTMAASAATLTVDGTSVAVNLDNGALGDCAPGSDCVMYLGQRASSGSSGVAYTLNGTITAASIDYFV